MVWSMRWHFDRTIEVLAKELELLKPASCCVVVFWKLVVTRRVKMSPNKVRNFT